MSELKPMSGETLDLTKENVEKLKELFPEVLTEDQIDFEKLRLILGDEVDDKPEKYSFTWNGKQDAMKLAQQPSTGTLRPNKEKSKNWDTTENLYIEGDNLEVLKLLQKSYAGKIKVIYIDPPYNTGSEFIYEDDFKDSIENYYNQSNQVDSEGNKLSTNSETSGRFHTNWLNMMYPRLILARNLMTEDGVIFISIDDYELANLRKITDEIFGINNFVAVLPTIMNLKGNQDEFGFAGTHEYTLVYVKNRNKTIFNEFPLDDDELEEWLVDEKGYYKQGATLKRTGADGPRDRRPTTYFPILVKDEKISLPTRDEYTKIFDSKTKQFDDNFVEDLRDKYSALGYSFILPITNESPGSWRWGFESILNNSEEIIIKESINNDYSFYKKQRPELTDLPSKKPKTLFYKPEYSSGNGTNQIKSLFDFNAFSNPKPVELIKDFVTIASSEKSIILDFFSGSSTTAEAVMKLNSEDRGNRKFIMVQLPEKIETSERAFKEGFDDISEIGLERISKSGNEITIQSPSTDIGYKVFELDNSNVKKWSVDNENLEDTLFSMQNNFIESRSHADIIYEVLLKIGLDLNTPFVESTVNDATVYDVAFGNVYVVLGNEITREVANFVVKKQKEYDNENPSVIFNDNGFINDNEKLNSVEILKNNGFNEEQLMSI